METHDPQISVTDAAKIIGRNRSTLFRHIKSGAVRSHEGKVRLSEVLEDLAANIDLTRSRRRAGEIDQFPEEIPESRVQQSDATPDATARPDATGDDDEPVIIVDGAVLSYPQARALKETYLARLKKLEFEMKRGELAPVETMVRFVEGVFSTVRERLLAIPGKLSGELEQIQVERLTAELFEALEELSDPRNAFDGADPFSDEDRGDDNPTEAATAPKPDRMGRALPIRRSEDIGRAGKVANERPAGRIRPYARPDGK